MTYCAKKKPRSPTQPEDFVAIEIAAALARDIRVIPVLVDEAHIPKASELPDPIRPLARRNAVEIRNSQFGRDAEALIENIRRALNGDSAASLSGRGHLVEERKAAEVEANGKAMEAATKAEQERQAKAVQEANAKRQADEARLAIKYNAGTDYYQRGDYDRAIANFNDAIELNPNNAAAFFGRGNAYQNKGDNDRAIADYNESIRLAPNSSACFDNRGNAYQKKGDYDRAIADFNEAIRLDPTIASTFAIEDLRNAKSMSAALVRILQKQDS